MAGPIALAQNRVTTCPALCVTCMHHRIAAALRRPIYVRYEVLVNKLGLDVVMKVI